MADMGVCVRCFAGEGGDEVEITEAGLCEECDREETKGGMGELDMGIEEE